MVERGTYADTYAELITYPDHVQPLATTLTVDPFRVSGKAAISTP
jgi:hypothetical protein